MKKCNDLFQSGSKSVYYCSSILGFYILKVITADYDYFVFLKFDYDYVAVCAAAFHSSQ